MLKIFWFRKDLRISDNKGLCEFVKSVTHNDKFLFLYIKNKNTFNFYGEKRIGFLLESLFELEKELKSSGFRLNIIEGKSTFVFQNIINEFKAVSVYCNEQPEPYCVARDNEVKDLIEKNGGKFEKYTDSTVFQLGEIRNGEGLQYKVYTPFKNECLKNLTSEHYRKIDSDLTILPKDNEVKLNGYGQYNIKLELDSIKSSEFIKGGRKEGLSLLKDFYESGLESYRSNRDFPSANGTSLLSAHFHFGTIGIREAFRTAFIKLNKSEEESKRNEIQTWINELLWREFYYNITFHNPQIAFESFKPEYDKLKWIYDEELFLNWCNGRTGYPIVDAGMRQLNQDGWMHNRVRMIAAMFLTKDLFMDWRLGEKYFAEKLIDLDFSSNNGGWQWSASTGVDAQPYFRIFNPYLQSKKFDAEGDYIRKYVPELSSLPADFIHEPNIMNQMEQKKYGVFIGKDYPSPVVDHMVSKNETIRRFKEILRSNVED